MTVSPRATPLGSRLPLGLLGAPFQVIVSAISILIAVTFLLQGLQNTADPVSILQTILAPPWVWVWGAFMAGGGSLSIIGVFRTRWSALGTELFGLGLMSTAWLVYAVALALEVGVGGLIPVSFGLAVVLASIVRGRALLLAAGADTTER